MEWERMSKEGGTTTATRAMIVKMAKTTDSLSVQSLQTGRRGAAGSRKRIHSSERNKG